MSATPDLARPDGPEVTRWLQVLGSEAGAVPPQAVYRLLYDELHRRARGYMRKESPEHTLSATGLVHEAWMRMSEQNRTEWRDRGHFIAVASTMMRRILVDHALAKRADKRAADLQPLSTTLLDHEGSNLDRDVVAVHDALLAFETVDPRAAKVVELRYFGGLELEEIGETLGVSLATVKRDWAVARAWLRREMGGR